MLVTQACGGPHQDRGARELTILSFSSSDQPQLPEALQGKSHKDTRADNGEHVPLLLPSHVS